MPFQVAPHSLRSGQPARSSQIDGPRSTPAMRRPVIVRDGMQQVRGCPVPRYAASPQPHSCNRSGGHSAIRPTSPLTVSGRFARRISRAMTADRLSLRFQWWSFVSLFGTCLMRGNARKLSAARFAALNSLFSPSASNAIRCNLSAALMRSGSIGGNGSGRTVSRTMAEPPRMSAVIRQMQRSVIGSVCVRETQALPSNTNAPRYLTL